MKLDENRNQTSGEGRLFCVGLTIAAGLLDFYTAFYMGAFLISLSKGYFVLNEFHLEDSSIAALIVFIVAYFIAGKALSGGTIWQRLLVSK